MIKIKKESIFTCVVALSFVLTTITELRIPGMPVGPGEIMMLFSSGVMFLKKRQTTPEQIHLQHIVINFWMVLFSSLLLGTMMNLLTMQRGLSFRTFAAYLFSAFVSYSIVRCYDEKFVQSIVKATIVIGAILFFTLCIYAKYKSKELFGLELMYYHRFCGGAKNPNQLALFLVPIPFIAIHFASDALDVKNLRAAIGWMLIGVACVYVGIQTNSDAIVGAWVIGIAYYVYRIAFQKLRVWERMLILFLIFAVMLSVFHKEIVYIISNWFSGLDGDGSRAALWRSGLESALDSLFMGYGPGAYGLSNYEIHNTYLDILTQGGLIAFVDFLYLLICDFRASHKTILRCTSLVSLCAFLMGHFALRQPVLFLYIILFLL